MGGAAPHVASTSLLSFNDHEAIYSGRPTSELVRAYLVFRLCAIRPFVVHSGSLLAMSHRVLGSTVTNAIVRHTFFKHFCAGETSEEVWESMRKLRKHGVSAILDYAAEDDVTAKPPTAAANLTQAPTQEDFQAGLDSGTTPTPMVRYKVSARLYDYESEKQCDRHVETFLKAVDTAAGLPGQGFAAIKVTALGNPTLLERCSKALQQVRGLFKRFDTDGSGSIDKQEFLAAYHTVFPEDSAEARDKAFAHFDSASQDGQVDYVEWCGGLRLSHLPGVAASIQQAYTQDEIDSGWLGQLDEVCLTAEEVELVDAMTARLDRIVARAVEKGVKLMVDAEHTYFQPAIDHVTLHMMKLYNKDGRATIYNTYQTYLVDAESRVRDDLQRSRNQGFTFAAKLVRGAYMSLERVRAEQYGYPSPIWPDIQATHACYDKCMEFLVDEVAEGRAEVMVASHNEASIQKCVSLMSARGLVPGQVPIYFGQLLGMADHLTFTLGKAGFPAFKYVPYGLVPEVVPYLLRRAQENVSIMQGTKADMALLTAELSCRMGLKRRTAKA